MSPGSLSALRIKIAAEPFIIRLEPAGVESRGRIRRFCNFLSTGGISTGANCLLTYQITRSTISKARAHVNNCVYDLLALMFSIGRDRTRHMCWRLCTFLQRSNVRNGIYCLLNEKRFKMMYVCVRLCVFFQHMFEIR